MDQARHDEKRAENLRKAKKDFLSEAEMDRVKYLRISLDAQLGVAQAGVAQAESQLRNSKANLTYTEIRAPEDGIVMERKVDVGQSIAVEFQAPVLFVVAPEIKKHVNVYASVDEADMGLIRRAIPGETPGDVHRGRLTRTRPSAGAISEVRINPAITQSVVTYDVVVEAPNPGMKLLPGMTANLTFQISVHDNVLGRRISPCDSFPRRSRCRREDRDLLEGGDFDVTGE